VLQELAVQPAHPLRPPTEETALLRSAPTVAKSESSRWVCSLPQTGQANGASASLIERRLLNVWSHV